MTPPPFDDVMRIQCDTHSQRASKVGGGVLDGWPTDRRDSEGGNSRRFVSVNFSNERFQVASHEFLIGQSLLRWFLIICVL